MLKKIKRIKKEEEKTTSTNSLDESREKVLAKGRKFKYPFQYSKHKMIINTILIAVAALGLLLIFGWFELYKVQDTSSVAFRFTKVLNLPVASVDGVDIRSIEVALTPWSTSRVSLMILRTLRCFANTTRGRL